MGSDERPPVVIHSDGGGNRGMLIALIVLVAVIAAAVWFFNQSNAGDPATDVTVELPTGEVDPGTETTLAP